VNEITIDYDRITLGDMESLEEHVGPHVWEELRGGKPSAKTLVALVWIMRRRDDPTFTLEDARQVPVVALKEAATDPFVSAGNGTSPPSVSPPA
jgi:hypothetical protein